MKLSQELFTVVSCFEVALRNRIDQHYTARLGADWLRDASLPGGIFDNLRCGKSPYIIASAIRKLDPYNHSKLIAELDFGFWRYTFARHQFFAGGQSLLCIFPGRPAGSGSDLIKFNHTYIFYELERVNLLRNRLAHHEPVCFLPGHPSKNTSFARQRYGIILKLFQWMQINEQTLLYGIDHVNTLVDRIDKL